MRLLFIGGPGSGKGTQTAYICQKYAVPPVSMGDILREAVANATPIGKEAKKFVVSGKLVPDEVVIAIVKERLQRGDLANGFVLDGFPRTVLQADALRLMLAEMKQELNAAIYLDVPDGDLVARLLERAKIEGRSDDTREVISTRIQNYKEKTRPLLAYYRQEGILYELNGIGAIEEVSLSLGKLLDKLS